IEAALAYLLELFTDPLKLVHLDTSLWMPAVRQMLQVRRILYALHHDVKRIIVHRTKHALEPSLAACGSTPASHPTHQRR
ncbi:MAG: hypothetical protein ACLQF1_00660, partial [Methyloceanibacter sp.]